MKKFLFASLGAVLLFTLPTVVVAAELYGKFSTNDSSILQGAAIFVRCDDWQQSAGIGRDGKYSVRGIPGNRGCYFTVQHPKYGESAEIRFNTNKSVITFNAELRLKDNRILVLRR